MNLLLKFACADGPMLDRLLVVIVGSCLSSGEVVPLNHALTIGESARDTQDIFNFFESKKC